MILELEVETDARVSVWSTKHNSNMDGESQQPMETNERPLLPACICVLFQLMMCRQCHFCKPARNNVPAYNEQQ
jgi:hypothetical protein